MADLRQGLLFIVIDPSTGEYPDLEKIALNEEWAQGLTYCDMDGFATTEDGTLLLLDECDNFAICPPGRFVIRYFDKENRYLLDLARARENEERITIKEAIEILDRKTTIPGDGYAFDQICEAFNMAIAALRLVDRERMEVEKKELVQARKMEVAHDEAG